MQRAHQLSAQVERIILQHGLRGMDKVYKAMKPGYCARAARLILENMGTIIIGTGFPVSCGYESDGPIGAVALYKVLEAIGGRPVVVCPSPLADILGRNFTVHELEIASTEASRKIAKKTIKLFQPDIVVSIEMPGAASDGRYYNMNKQDISHMAPKFDWFVTESGCPSVCFGDGGNEVGMGKISHKCLDLDIIPSVAPCDELVIASVSNWGVYGVIALLCILTQQDLFSCFSPACTAQFLVANGCVDGITIRPNVSEDGFPIQVGVSIIEQLRELIGAGN